jgi:hypothetical protein
MLSNSGGCETHNFEAGSMVKEGEDGEDIERW